jgi:aminomethyltransferase
VAWNKPDFVGRDAALAERERGVARRLVGIRTDGRRPARAGCAVLVDDAVIGEVTSGNFSPVLGHGIAMAFVDPALEAGTPVNVDVRGKLLPGALVDMPFLAN